jgi:thiol-disulfide isomerase/thioredoxin
VLSVVMHLCALLVLAPLRAGTVAPSPIEVDTLDQGRVRLELSGQITIVDFFATWCPRCRESLPDYQKLVAEHGDHLRVILIDVEESPAVVRRFFARHPLPDGVLVAFDPTALVFHGFGATGFPTFFVLDKGGVVRFTTAGWGEGSADELGEWVDHLARIAAGKARQANRAAPRARGKRSSSPAREAKSESEEDHARKLGVEILR